MKRRKMRAISGRGVTRCVRCVCLGEAAAFICLTTKEKAKQLHSQRGQVIILKVKFILTISFRVLLGRLFPEYLYAL